MHDETSLARRRLLQTALAGTAAAAGGWVLGCQAIGRMQPIAGPEDDDQKVTPGEDLMQEHGVLKRLLLVYQAAIRRIQQGQEVPADSLRSAGSLVRSFVEDYHEKSEEKLLFPRFRQRRKLVDLVDVLYAQHQAGRRVTARIIELATVSALRDAGQSRELASRMESFIRMYEVHEAREDTVLFPAFREMLSKNEYDALGERFEKEEHEHFGGDGFELAVDQVATIEKAFGIYDLGQFTPQV